MAGGRARWAGTAQTATAPQHHGRAAETAEQGSEPDHGGTGSGARMAGPAAAGTRPWRSGSLAGGATPAAPPLARFALGCQHCRSGPGGGGGLRARPAAPAAAPCPPPLHPQRSGPGGVDGSEPQGPPAVWLAGDGAGRGRHARRRSDASAGLDRWGGPTGAAAGPGAVDCRSARRGGAARHAQRSAPGPATAAVLGRRAGARRRGSDAGRLAATHARTRAAAARCGRGPDLAPAPRGAGRPRAVRALLAPSDAVGFSTGAARGPGGGALPRWRHAGAPNARGARALATPGPALLERPHPGPVCECGAATGRPAPLRGELLPVGATRPPTAAALAVGLPPAPRQPAAGIGRHPPRHASAGPRTGDGAGGWLAATARGNTGGGGVAWGAADALVLAGSGAAAAPHRGLFGVPFSCHASYQSCNDPRDWKVGRRP